MKYQKIMRRMMGCAAAILALTACSESEDLLSAFHSDPNAVRITAQVGKASANGFTRSNPLGATEADQKKFNDGDMISVQADGQDAVTYQLNGDEWQPQGGKFLKWESNEMNFTAYYPASFNGTINQPTEYNSLKSLADADFMSYRGLQSNTNKSNQLTLVMNRMMARVIVEIAGFNDQYTKNATVNSLSICGVKAYKHETDGKFYALIDPNYTPSTAPFLSLEVADGESKTTEKYTTTPTTFVAGKSYTYQLTVGKNKISVSGITVADWDNTGIITEGSKAEQIIRYVTFTAEKEQKFKMTTSGNYTISGLQYSVNNGKWENVEKDIPVAFGGTNGTLRLRGTNIKGTASNRSEYSKITFTDKNVKVACTGDIRTLLNWKNYSTVDTQNAIFCYLFDGCAALTSAPELPATKLADYCYYSMFEGCTSLTAVPELPATTLANHCYHSMFGGCTSLTAASELKATTLANFCYYNMFDGCTSLTSAPELKATTLAYYCYYCMFYGCTSLTTAPALKATTLAYGCYYSMFEGCTSLTTAPALKATKLAGNCYNSMFYDCTSLTDAPELKATKLANGCYDNMFNGCTKLPTVTMLAPSDQISKASNCCYKWLYNAGTDETVSSRTLKVMDADAYTALEGKGYLPDNWKKDATNTTVEYYTPKP